MHPLHHRRLLPLLLACLLVLAAAPHGAAREDAQHQAAGNRQWHLPGGASPYPAYFADPRQPRLDVGLALLDGEVPRTSDGRVLLAAGTRFALLALEAGSAPHRGGTLSLDFEGGFFHRFDLGNSVDAVAWDGVWNLFGTRSWPGKAALRAGIKHLSAHLGDEYQETVGVGRINYSRTALAIGAAWVVAPGWTAYLEPGWGYRLGNADRQEPWALEGGIQYQGPFDLWRQGAALYGGLHLAAYQETSWEPALAARLGIVLRRPGDPARVRLWLAGYGGRALPGEFALDHDEKHLAAGLTIELF